MFILYIHALLHSHSFYFVNIHPASLSCIVLNFHYHSTLFNNIYLSLSPSLFRSSFIFFPCHQFIVETFSSCEKAFEKKHLELTHKWAPRNPPTPVEQGPAINPVLWAIRRSKAIRDKSLVGCLRWFSKLFECVSVPAKLDDVLNVEAERLNELKEF